MVSELLIDISKSQTGLRIEHELAIPIIPAINQLRYTHPTAELRRQARAVVNFNEWLSDASAEMLDAEEAVHRHSSVD